MSEQGSSSSIIVSHRLFCQRSGLPIATVEFITTAGTLPYMTLWNDNVVYHPVFSMQPYKLLEFARSEWQRLAGRAADNEITEAESNILRVCFLAMLHNLDSIKQDTPALPPLAVVQSNIEQLFNLAGWKYFLESKRFRFPTLALSKLNANLDFSTISSYLSLCWETKHEYENKVSESVEQEKIKAAEKALAALRSEWVVPVSKKLLFQWVKAHLPAKYHPDAEGWLGTLFLGNDKTILEFEEEDIQLAIEIIYCCPAGSSIFKAVKDRLEHIQQVWSSHYEAWEIDLADDEWNDSPIVNGSKIATPHPGPEPKIGSFDSRGSYIRAKAQWDIAMARWNREQENQE